MEWLTQYFLNPGYVLPGAALASVPIIIHLLSRLRYKRVRFAAMEFLLQSDEQNRRRLIIEQILLLLLRVLAIVVIVLLIGRLILDPSNMLLLRGATTHHVLILDDTLSMRQQGGNETLFESATAALERVISEGTGKSGTQQVSVLLMTQPRRPVLMDRPLDNATIQELLPRLRNLKCSYETANIVDALEAAEDILEVDGGVAPQLHIVTDLRRSDWLDQPEVAGALKSLDSIDAGVNLIQVADSSVKNVAVTAMTADTLSTAVGIPWRIHLTIRNHSTKEAADLRATVSVDGNELPANILIPDVGAGEDIEVAHDIVFENSGQHEVRVMLDEDVLPEDNVRFLVADVTDKRVILLVDDGGQQEDAGYVAAALSADPDLTGLTVEQRTSSVLTSTDLDRYDCIYLMNVRDLPADATLLLSQYVSSGGGIVWFPGDQANTNWYNETLQEDGVELFPVLLTTVQSIESGDSDNANFQHLLFDEHPIFSVYNIPDSPFADTIQISKWFGVQKDEQSEVASENARIIGRLRNGQPVIFEHESGTGKVLTFLTSAGRNWSNWPIAPASPGYVVMHLLIHQYLQKPNDAVQVREVGGDVRLSWNVGQFTESVEVFLPESKSDEQSTEDTFLRVTATPVTDDEEDTQDSSAEENSTTSQAGQLQVSIPQVDRPGVYRIRRFPIEGPAHDTWLAMNVTAAESNLAVADGAEIEQLPGLEHVSVVEADSAGALSNSDSGREMRWFLLGLLLAILVAEQLLSLRMSFHPEVKP